MQLLQLRSPSLERAESTTAQVGNPNGPSQNSYENIKWKDWLASREETDNCHHDMRQATASSSPPRPISPGVSHRHWAPPEADDEPAGATGIERVPSEDPFLIAESTSRPSSTDSTGPESGLARLMHLRDPYDALLEGGVEQSEASRGHESQFIVEDQGQAPKEPLSESRGRTQYRDVLSLMDLLNEDEHAQQACESHKDSRQDSPMEDEDEIWKKFMLDDDPCEITRKACEEAYEQTRRQLRQPPSPLPASDVAEAPSTRPSPDPSISISDRLNSCDLPPQDDGTDTRKPHSPQPSANTELSSTSSLIAHPASPSSRAQPSSSSDFKFHQPRLFVGRLAGDKMAQAPPTPAAVLRGKARLRGARRRRSRDTGRPDIRALPNFEGELDPIEEG